MSDWVYEHVEIVRFGDLDAMRHLNNVVFLRYFETARINYMRDFIPGRTPADPEGTFNLIFAECHIRYRSPGFFDDEVKIRLRPSHIERSSFRLEFEMATHDRVLAEGYGVLVGYDYAEHKAQPLPQDFKERLL